MSAKYKSPSFLLPNELNTSTNPLNTDGNPATGTGINSLYSMNFDSAASDYIDIGYSLDGLSSITYSCWVKASAFKNWNYIISAGNYAINQRLFGILLDENGSFQAYGGYSSGAILDSNVDLASNTWYHLAVVYTNNQDVVFYVNGVGGLTKTFTNTNLIAASSPTRIGSYTGSVANLFDGQIDEVAIFNRALNTTEIAALYDGTGSNIRPSNLMAANLNPLAYYPLGEQAQNTGYLTQEITNGWQFPNGVLQDYVFNFSSDRITIPSYTITAASTVSLWVRSSEANPNDILLGGSTGNYYPNFYVPAGGGNAGKITIPLAENASNSTIVTDVDYAINTWYHLAISQTGGTATVYIDGINKGTGVARLPILTSMGAYSNGNNDLQGQMSNVAFFNTPLLATGTESIASLYNNGSPPADISSYSGLQRWYKLNADSIYTPSAPNYTTALDFDGTNDDITISAPADLSISGDLTMSMWFKADSFSDYEYILRLTSATGGSALGKDRMLGFSIYSGSYRLSANTYQSLAWGNTALSTNVWYHAAVVYSSGSFVLYLNGQADSLSTAVTMNPITYVNTTIGKSYNTNYFDGSISNVTIFDSALTSSQISTLFNFGTPQDAISFSPKAWWKLNDQNVITDYSGNGNTGNNNGATNAPGGVVVVPSWKIPDASGTANGVSTTLPSTALQQSDLQFDSPYSNFSLSFDGNTYVDCGTSLNSSLNGFSNSFSVSLWVKVTNTSTRRGIIGNYTQSSGIGFYIDILRVNDTTFTFKGGYHSNSGTFVFRSSSSQFTTNNWHHLSMTVDSGGSNNSVNIYVDGVLNNGASQFSQPISYTNTNNLKIANIAFGGDEIIGKIDETSIFNYSLSDAQVLEIYNSGRPKDLSSFSGTAPISWWRLGEDAFFAGNVFTTPNSISGAPNGIGSGTVNTMISADAPGTFANGIGTNLDIEDRVGDAALSTSNSQSYNMIPSNISPYIPEYIGDQIDNVYSMAFNGVDQYFAFDDLALSSNEYTISLWMYSDIGTNAGYFLTNGNTEASAVGFKIDNNGANIGRLEYWDGTNNTFGTIPSPASWNHVAFVANVSGSTITSYINGSVDTTVTGVTVQTMYNLIGAYTPTGGNKFLGKIDEVAIFNTALSAAQIKNDIYNASLPLSSNKTADLENNPNLPTPVAWYRMGDN